MRKVEIPKPGGGVGTLGIPTVLDRLIQQALHQELMRLFDTGFSEYSYGFRPGRSAHQAVQSARRHVASGRRWVVDIDLEKFFDRVGHDIRMLRVSRKVKDRRVLRLIRRHLTVGVLVGGIVSPWVEGTPQGGPLSPLLSNILLDEFDKVLERRGHAFCHYADDCNIYVHSSRRLNQTEAALHPVASVEAPLHHGQEFDEAGIDGASGVAVSYERARSLVELRSLAYARCTSEILLRQTGAGLVSGSQTLSVSFVNRRVRNRTHGGVGGRRG